MEALATTGASTMLIFLVAAVVAGFLVISVVHGMSDSHDPLSAREFVQLSALARVGLSIQRPVCSVKTK